MGLTLYRLARGCDFQVIEDVFGVSRAIASETFSNVIRILVSELYDRFVVLQTEEEWKLEAKSFLENYSFPCVGAWDGFHVQVGSRLKNHYSFKHKYTITNMGFIGHNKRFLNLTCNAPGSTHDAWLLRRSKIFHDIQAGNVLPNASIDLGEKIGKLPLTTVGDTAFPQFEWLIKAYPNTKDPKKRYFNTKLCGARIVTENAYGMLKGRWRILHKKCDARLYNVKYIVMACVMLHNLCIGRKDPCKLRRKLRVEKITLVNRNLHRDEKKEKSRKVADKIADWLWTNA